MNGTPSRALALLGVLSIVVPVSMIAVGVKMSDAMDYTIQIASFGFLGGYLAVCVAAPAYLLKTKSLGLGRNLDRGDRRRRHRGRLPAKSLSNPRRALALPSLMSSWESSPWACSSRGASAQRQGPPRASLTASSRGAGDPFLHPNHTTGRPRVNSAKQDEN